ncbi:Acg family FMN-binding oxidoreductase [Nocardia colli]|uniref:Acg family FMN-binding oxidoreductase n=1 Tax=Nocardia colli TaxID=2545717 RepID=UPI0035D7C3E7
MTVSIANVLLSGHGAAPNYLDRKDGLELMASSPSMDTVKIALEMAVRAPSIHNTQPWRWRIRDHAIELWADPQRHLVTSDPGQGKLIVSCGAALHHLRIALAVLGWSATVTHLPDPDQPDHLATVETTPHEPAQADIELGAALLQRHTDRRGYRSLETPPGYLRTISAGAAKFGAVVRHVPESLRLRLVQPFQDAVIRHADDRDYQRELATWSGQRRTADGVPGANVPHPHLVDQIPARVFAGAELIDRHTDPDAAEWFVICTPHDDRRSQLRAGETTSALLLEATRLGLSTCLQTEPLGLPELRDDIRSTVLYDCAFPQSMIRIGWIPTDSAPLAPTPRRPIEDTIDV